MYAQSIDLIDAGSASWRGDFGIGRITVQQMTMSAFPESGRSNTPKPSGVTGSVEVGFLRSNWALLDSIPDDKRHTVNENC